MDLERYWHGWDAEDEQKTDSKIPVEADPDCLYMRRIKQSILSPVAFHRMHVSSFNSLRAFGDCGSSCTSILPKTTCMVL